MYEQYTDEQIAEMLVPKLKKAVPELNWDEYLKRPDVFSIWNRLISVIYKSGYIRGQLGRSFIIGEKKEKTDKTGHWIPVNYDGSNVKKDNYVRYAGKHGHENIPEFFPAKDTAGKVIKVCSNQKSCYVQWPKGSTSSDDKWYAAWGNLEVLLCE